MSGIDPIQGEALKKALENQKPDPKPTIAELEALLRAEHKVSLNPDGSMSATAVGGVAGGDSAWQARYAAEEARRNMAHAKAMKSGYLTSEWVTMMLALLGSSAGVLAIIYEALEKLAVLKPEWAALGAAVTAVGWLAAVAKMTGDYAKSRVAVKGAGRLLVAILAVGLSTGCVNFRPPAPPRVASLAPEAAPFEFTPPPECKTFDRDRKVWGALGRSAALGSGAAGLTSLVTDNDSGGLRRGFGLASLALGIFAAGASWYADQQAADYVSRCTQ